MSYKITDNCIGCTLCTKSCPVHAISGELKQQHIINPKRCVDCGVCGGVCPKASIIDNFGNVCSKVNKNDRLKPIVNAEKCTACSICVDICGFDCLSISLPKFQMDIDVYAELTNENKCVDCKMCMKACPVSAIKMGGRG